MSSGVASDRPASGIVLPVDFVAVLAASFLLGLANANNHGFYAKLSLVLVLGALGLLGWRTFARDTALTMRADVGCALVLGALLFMPVVALWDADLVMYAQRPWHVVRAALAASLVLCLTYVPFLPLPGRKARVEPPRLRTLRFALFGLLVLIAGIAVIRISPAPIMDVWHIQMRGAEALLRGENPYTSVTVQDTDPENTFTVPYVYPPTALYFGAVARLLGPDVRYAMLFACFTSGLALRYITRRSAASAGVALPSVAEDAPALFFWLTPILPFVIEQSWIDPVQVMLICAGTAAHVGKKPLLAALVFGVAISSKQSMFWLVPLVGFTLRFNLRAWAAMLGTAFALVLPFMIWDFARLKYANFDFMTSLPARGDGLALGAWYSRTFQRPFPAGVAFLLSFAAASFAVWRIRSTGGFARVLAFTYLVFFFFNKWAFANYYFLLTALAALAAACSLEIASPQRSASPRETAPP